MTGRTLWIDRGRHTRPTNPKHIRNTLYILRDLFEILIPAIRVLGALARERAAELLRVPPVYRQELRVDVSDHGGFFG